MAKFSTVSAGCKRQLAFYKNHSPSLDTEVTHSKQSNDDQCLLKEPFYIYAHIALHSPQDVLWLHPSFHVSAVYETEKQPSDYISFDSNLLRHELSMIKRPIIFCSIQCFVRCGDSPCILSHCFFPRTLFSLIILCIVNNCSLHDEKIQSKTKNNNY